MGAAPYGAREHRGEGEGHDSKGMRKMGNEQSAVGELDRIVLGGRRETVFEAHGAHGDAAEAAREDAAEQREAGEGLHAHRWAATGEPERISVQPAGACAPL